jgi:hypothetical protein
MIINFTHFQISQSQSVVFDFIFLFLKPNQRFGDARRSYEPTQTSRFIYALLAIVGGWHFSISNY